MSNFQQVFFDKKDFLFQCRHSKQLSSTNLLLNKSNFKLKKKWKFSLF
jgi:hypothetical protein